jgi:DNA-binding NtrC family response regulator
MRVLLVDDEQLSRKSIANFLQHFLGLDVDECDDAELALSLWNEKKHPLIISDIKMPKMSGLELLTEIKSYSEGKFTDVIMITGHADFDTALQALRAGAWDYLKKPIDVEELASVIEKSQEHLSLLKENTQLKTQFEEKLYESTLDLQIKFDKIKNAYLEVAGIGQVGIFSEKMTAIQNLALSFHKDRSVPVLITGETGTGKEIIARMIHYGDGQVTTPFITINCSSISPSLFESELFGYEGGSFTGSKKTGLIGKLEMAQGGTIFLDEIGDMPLELQPKLLRVIQQKEMYRVGGIKKIDLNVRFICATNRDIPEMINQGLFRKDLFYRLNTGSIHIPSLKERKEDIMPLAQMFLTKFSEMRKRKFKFMSQDTITELENYDWPGNIRELQNVIERCTVLYDEIELKPYHLNINTGEGPNHLVIKNITNDDLVLSFPSNGVSLEDIEETIVSFLVEKFDGNKSKVASYLNVSRNTIRRKLKEL